jgi:hypothetical protein
MLGAGLGILTSLPDSFPKRFRDITDGMTKAEVLQLVGRKEDQSGTTYHYGRGPPQTWKSYRWLDDDGVLTVHFDETRMVVTGKYFVSW